MLWYHLELQQAEEPTNATICINCSILLHSKGVKSFSK